jgi:hypothetical protein
VFGRASNATESGSGGAESTDIRVEWREISALKSGNGGTSSPSPSMSLNFVRPGEIVIGKSGIVHESGAVDIIVGNSSEPEGNTGIAEVEAESGNAGNNGDIGAESGNAGNIGEIGAESGNAGNNGEVGADSGNAGRAGDIGAE